ncbi:MAG: ankyrin repeat domain-containing protein, partial [Phycisphaerae bacterium]
KDAAMLHRADVKETTRTLFVSYSMFDEEAASAIAAAVRNTGVNTWLYSENGVIGPNYTEQVAEAIGNADALLVVISEEAARSNQVKDEVRHAKEEGLRRIPVLIGLTHELLMQNHPEWKHLIGGGVSVVLPQRARSSVIPKIVQSVCAAVDAPAPPKNVLKGAHAPGPARKVVVIAGTLALGIAAVTAGYSLWGNQLSRSNPTTTDVANTNAALEPLNANEAPVTPPIATESSSGTEPIAEPPALPTVEPTPKNLERLNRAVRENDVATVSMLSSLAGDVRLDGSGESLLHLAVRHNANRVAPLLLQTGIPLDIASHERDHTALHLAAMKCRSGFVRMILEKKPDATKVTIRGDTALHLAADNPSCVDVIEELIQYGVNPNVENVITGDTPLHVAARAHAWKCVKVLLDNGANPNHINGDGESPLIVSARAVSFGQQHEACQSITTLLEAGADLTATSRSGRTAIELARDSGWSDVVHCLTTFKTP